MPAFGDTNPFLGEISIVSFNFAPQGWALCNGQLLPINQNQALFALLGTMYGGNGTTNFALPDMRGLVPIHVGGGFTQGAEAGEASHTLMTSEMPTHIHALNATTDPATVVVPGGNLFAAVDSTTFGAVYASASALNAMAPETIANIGGSQPHNNMQPYLTLNFIIALQGIFPSQN